MPDIHDAEFVETVHAETSALALPEPAKASLGLFRTDDPSQVIIEAAKVATSLKDVLDKCKLIQNIQGKEHVKVEGWLTLASMLNLSPVNEWTRKTEDPDGWEAACVLKNLQGEIVARGEASCGRDERRWKTAENFAIRSMAQTRAQAKAISSKLRFIMVLAGYSGTPAEEMGNAIAETPQPRYTNQEQINRLNGQMKDRAIALGVCKDGTTFLAWVRSDVGIDEAVAGWKPSQAQRDTVNRLLDHMQEQIADRTQAWT